MYRSFNSVNTVKRLRAIVLISIIDIYTDICIRKYLGYDSTLISRDETIHDIAFTRTRQDDINALFLRNLQ